MRLILMTLPILALLAIGAFAADFGTKEWWDQQQGGYSDFGPKGDWQAQEDHA